MSSPGMAGPLIASPHAYEWSGLPQKGGGSAFLSGIVHATGSETAATHLDNTHQFEVAQEPFL